MSNIKEKINDESRENMNEGIGSRIRLIRKKLGLNMEDFGKLFNPKASKGVVSNWENNYNLPNNERLKKIAELGKVSTTYLLEGKKTIEDFNYMNWEELKKNPELIENLIQSNQKMETVFEELSRSAANAFNDLDLKVDDIQKNIFVTHAREFLDIYPPETIGLVASTLQTFNELHEEIQNNSKSEIELKKYIEARINEEIELSKVVYDSVKEVLYNEIDNKK